MDSIKKFIEKFYEGSILQHEDRTGFTEDYWNVHDIKCQTVAEHTYSSLFMAGCIYDLGLVDSKIDIIRVLAMLGIHETDEITLGDITCIEKDKNKQQYANQSKAAVLSFTVNFKNNTFTNLINEFEAQETLEAQFAFLCDKLDAVMMAKWYSDNGYMTVEEAGKLTLENPKTLQLIKGGIHDAGILWQEYESDRLDLLESTELKDLYKNILKELRNYKIKS